MKTKLLPLLLFSIAAKLAQAQVMYDPSQDANQNVFTSVSSDAMAAQTFTVSSNGLLTEIMFYGGGMGGNSPLFVGVYKTSNGIPNDSSDNLLGQVQIDANDLPTSDSWVKINFSTQNILLDSTEIYALIFSRPQYDGKSIYWKGTTTNQYEGNFYSKVQYMGNTWKEPNGISNEHIDMGLGMTVISNLNTPITSLNTPTANSIDLSSTLSQSSSRVKINDNLTYTAAATNNGTGTANNVALKFMMPPRWTNYISLPSDCVFNGTLTVCNVGSLTAGATVQRAITVSFQKRGAISMGALVTTDSDDSNLANNMSRIITSITK